MPTLEERVAQLEQEVKKLNKPSKESRPWWEKRLGAFANDPFYDEAMEAAKEYRQSQKPDYSRDTDSLADVSS